MEPSHPGAADACRVVPATPSPHAPAGMRAPRPNVRDRKTTSPPTSVRTGVIVLDALLGAREDVVGQHDEIRVLAGLERAERILLPRRVRVPARERANRFLARHALLGLPASILAAARPPRDGGVEAVKRARALDREVGAARDDDAGREQGAPGVRARGAGPTEPLGRPFHVGGAVGRLHARQGAEPRESAGYRARSESGRARRESDDPATGRARALLERVQGQRVRAIADRVHANLKPSAAASSVSARDLVGRDQHEPGIAGIVAVRVVQRGAARAERAVGHQLAARPPRHGRRRTVSGRALGRPPTSTPSAPRPPRSCGTETVRARRAGGTRQARRARRPSRGCR